VLGLVCPYGATNVSLLTELLIIMSFYYKCYAPMELSGIMFLDTTLFHKCYAPPELLIIMSLFPCFKLLQVKINLPIIHISVI